MEKKNDWIKSCFFAFQVLLRLTSSRHSILFVPHINPNALVQNNPKKYAAQIIHCLVHRLENLPGAENKLEQFISGMVHVFVSANNPFERFSHCTSLYETHAEALCTPTLSEACREWVDKKKLTARILVLFHLFFGETYHAL